jgi:hypothetical protein
LHGEPARFRLFLPGGEHAADDLAQAGRLAGGKPALASREREQRLDEPLLLHATLRPEGGARGPVP